MRAGFLNSELSVSQLKLFISANVVDLSPVNFHLPDSVTHVLSFAGYYCMTLSITWLGQMNSVNDLPFGTRQITITYNNASIHACYT